MVSYFTFQVAFRHATRVFSMHDWWVTEWTLIQLFMRVRSFRVHQEEQNALFRFPIVVIKGYRGKTLIWTSNLGCYSSLTEWKSVDCSGIRIVLLMVWLFFILTSIGYWGLNTIRTDKFSKIQVCFHLAVSINWICILNINYSLYSFSWFEPTRSLDRNILNWKSCA